MGLLSPSVAEASLPRPDGGPSGGRWDEARRTGGDDDAAATAPADARWEDWVGEIRADAARDHRRREHWLRRQAADDASLTGVLVDLAEQGHLVRVTTTGGGRHLGRVRGAGAEVVVLESGRHRVVIAADAVSTVQAAPGEQTVTSPTGHRVGDDPTTLGDLLSHAVGDAEEVTLVTRTGQVLVGELVAVGRDVVMVRPDRRTPVVYARLESLSEALLPLSAPLSTRSG